MALIEHLERDNWEELFADFFRNALVLLKENPHQPAGSATDDIKSWLRAGGCQRVHEQLVNQMEMLRFPPQRVKAVLARLAELKEENSELLINLSTKGIIPGNRGVTDTGTTEMEITSLLSRMMAGERPFEDRMRELGHSDEEIAEAYQAVDKSLEKSGHPVALPWKPERATEDSEERRESERK